VAVIRSTSRSVLAGLLAGAGLALAGCGAGQVSQTAVQSPTIDGVSAQVGTMSIRNLALEYPDDGTYAKGDDARLRMVVANDGTTSDTLIAVRSTVSAEVRLAAASSSAGATPTLTATPPSNTPTATGTASGTPTGSNEPPDSTVTGTATTGPSQGPSASASPSETGSAPAEAPAAQIQIPANGVVSFVGDGPTVLLTGLTTRLYPAQTLQVTLVFQQAGSVTQTIAVSAPQGQISLAPTVTSDTEG
jgi:copper(I)-binding protein